MLSFGAGAFGIALTGSGLPSASTIGVGRVGRGACGGGAGMFEFCGVAGGGSGNDGFGVEDEAAAHGSV